MPISVRRLPDNPNLEHLRSEAKQLARQCRSGDIDALGLVETVDPRTAAVQKITLAAAQRVVARSYGFASWARLKDHVQFVTDHTRWPEPAAESAPLDPGARADHLLQLGCLNYTRDHTDAVRQARTMLTTEPALGLSNAFTMAATGAHQELARLLSEDPDAIHATGGPFDWPALLYLAYGRLGDAPGRSAVHTATVLLEAGADPNAGFLWQGMTSPFTALTGVLGGGEQDQPAHPDSIPLARLLLEAGADPNDNQALYNRMFSERDDHLELLFAHGLGKPFESVWRRRLGDGHLLTNHYPTPGQMVTEQLRWAASHGMTGRIRLLLDHGVDPDGRGYHPNFGDQTSYRMAVLAGFPEIARLLAEAGADTSVVDTVDEFVGACLRGDAEAAAQLTEGGHDVVPTALEREPDAVATAASLGRLDAVRLLLDRGFEVELPDTDRSALHLAAALGRADIARLLVDRGADATRTDTSYHATPAAWADHHGHPRLAAELRAAALRISPAGRGSDQPHAARSDTQQDPR